MEYSNGVIENITVAVYNNEMLEEVKKYFKHIETTSGVINFNVEDIVNLFNGKGMVLAECATVSGESFVDEAVQGLLSQLRKRVDNEISSVLWIATGEVSLVKMAEVSDLIQNNLGSAADVCFGLYDGMTEKNEIGLMLVIA